MPELFGSQEVMLFKKVMEPLRGGALLEELHHRELDFINI